MTVSSLGGGLEAKNILFFSAEAKAVDFLQYATVGALCDPTADVPFAALSDMTRCLGPVFTAAARVDPMGSAVVGAASLAAAAGHITPRASDGHPALLARHVVSMLKTTRSSFPACLRTNSFQNYSAEVETRAEYVGGTTVARDRVAEQRCPRAIAAKAPTLDSLLRALPRPTPPSVVYEAYRQLVSLYFPTDRRPMDLLLTDLDAQLHARLHPSRTSRHEPSRGSAAMPTASRCSLPRCARPA